MVQIGDMTIQDEAVVLPATALATFSRASGAGNGSVGYTGIGFKPSYVIFIMASNNEPSSSWGFDNAVINTYVQTPENEGAPTSGTWQIEGKGGEGSILYVDVSGAGEINGFISSMDSDGFTIDWTQTGTPGHSCQVKAICFK